MANTVSNEAKEIINKYKQLLRTNNLTEFYTHTGRYTAEITQFFFTMGVDVFKYLTKIPRNFLFGADEIKDIDIPGNIDSIGREAFKQSSIESVKLEDGVSVIDAEAFEGCKSLKHVDLGRVSVIKDGAFRNCNALREVYLPDSVIMMGRNVWPDNIVIKSGPRKKKTLRFPKAELDWYKSHLILYNTTVENELGEGEQ